MTERTSLDRDLATYFQARSTSRAPVGLLEASLAGVDHTRQRPAWQLVGRRLADSRAGRWSMPVSSRLVLAVVLLLVALVVGVLVVASTQRRLPPPFGPAKPGLLVADISGRIGVMNADGTNWTLLTSAQEEDRYPIWSPDGTRIAFVSYADRSRALLVMDADGGHRFTLSAHQHGVSKVRGDGTNFGSPVPMSWSPDSQRIVFAAAFGGDPPQLYVTPADRPDEARLLRTGLYGASPSWSPDGTQIAFMHLFDGSPDGLWVIRPDGEQVMELSVSPQIRDVFTGASWSPDGKRLAFLADGKNHSYDVFVINADGTDQRDITNTPEDEQWASWSPDGTRLAYSWFQGAVGTFVIDADGSNRVELPTDGHSISTPAWSPDGSQILGYLDWGLVNSTTDGIMVLDPTGHDRPKFIPEPEFGSVTWQRLAP